MGVKEYSIAFAIAGKLSGAFSKSFKKAGATVDKFSDQISKLNADSARMFQLTKAQQ